MTLTHSNYPHEIGTLYDCEACEALYYTIVFMDGDEAYTVLEMIENADEGYKGDYESAIEYLKQWDFGDESEHDANTNPWGSGDQTLNDGDYVMAWNMGLGYISLQRKVLPA